MNSKTKVIIEELIDAGLITKEEDLTAGDNTNLIFDYMIRKYSHLLSDDINIILPDSQFEKGKIIHELIMHFGKLFLKNPQIIEDKYDLIADDVEVFPEIDREKLKQKIVLPEEPVIFVTNHGFKDDVLATMLAAKRRAFIVFGSLPQFYGTIDGLLSAKNGVVMVNRKIPNSRGTSVDKAKYVLENGMSLMVCPEGVWNKSPNLSMQEFWSGFYRMAKKDDGSFYPIVPIVHYVCNTHKPGRDNPIHTIVDFPIYLDGMDEKEGIEYIRTRMLTWYWKLMEKFGTTTREELLDGYNDSLEAWEDELRKRVQTADKYDYEIEICADKMSTIKRKQNPIDVWQTIADISVTKDNAREVMAAKKLVKELKENDFQHRF